MSAADREAVIEAHLNELVDEFRTGYQYVDEDILIAKIAFYYGLLHLLDADDSDRFRRNITIAGRFARGVKKYGLEHKIVRILGEYGRGPVGRA